MRSMRRLRHLACGLGLLACGGSPEARVPAPSPRLFDPLAYRSLPGPERAFGVRDGALRSYFHRDGPVVVNLLAQSGPSPSVIARFSGSERGVGLWFSPASADAELYAGESPDAEHVVAGGGLVAIRRDQGRNALHGVRATLRSNAKHLVTELVLLGSSRTLRDYTEDLCLDQAESLAELDQQRFELDAGRNALRISGARQGSAEPSLELLLTGVRGTRIVLREREDASAAASCARPPGPGQPETGESGTSQPGLGESGTSTPEPGQPGTSQPDPGESATSEPDPGQPGASQPAPSQPAPSQPAPSQPAPSQSGASQPRVELTNDGGIELQIMVLASDGPLDPAAPARDP